MNAPASLRYVPTFEELGIIAHSGTTTHKQQEAVLVLDEKPQGRFPFGLRGEKGEELREGNSQGGVARSPLHRVRKHLQNKGEPKEPKASLVSIPHELGPLWKVPPLLCELQ